MKGEKGSCGKRRRRKKLTQNNGTQAGAGQGWVCKKLPALEVRSDLLGDARSLLGQVPRGARRLLAQVRVVLTVRVWRRCVGVGDRLVLMPSKWTAPVRWKRRGFVPGH
eukprot:1109177-Rhodomonas_salina.1